MLRDQIAPRNPLDPRTFLAWGVLLFGIKYAIDAAVAYVGFQRPWTPWDYLVTSLPVSFLTIEPHHRAFYITLLFIALPFIVFGVLLTLRRLRDCGLPTWLALLFFIPVINLFFFLILAVIPSRRPIVSIAKVLDVALDMPTPVLPVDPMDAPANHPDASIGYGHHPAAVTGFRSWFPMGNGSSLLFASIVPIPFALLLTLMATQVMQSYGFGVFVALPFVQGLLAASLHGVRVKRSMGQSLSAGALCGAVSLIAIFAFAIEGAGCLIMLLPLATPISLLGAVVGHTLQAGASPQAQFRSAWVLLLVLPLFMGAEHFGAPEAPIYCSTTSVVIDDPPDAVWKNVIQFGTIDPPTDWPFRFGVAYPINATISGRGVGAIRNCNFSTGAFVEPITAWDEARLLKFDVTSNPPAMREWSPYSIHPPHIKDFLVSKGGQFALIPLDDGKRTRLEGTTWYQHHLWPASYWSWWSDYIIHRIHGRVLNKVKELSERQAHP